MDAVGGAGPHYFLMKSWIHVTVVDAAHVAAGRQMGERPYRQGRRHVDVVLEAVQRGVRGTMHPVRGEGKTHKQTK